MKSIKFRHLILPLFSLLALTACSPHPGTGVWQASGDNELGFSTLIVAFESKAEFTSMKPVEAKWHCFWSKKTDQSLSLDCTPSTNIDQARKFSIIAKDKMNAEFREGDKLIANLKRIDADPSLTK